MISGRGSEHHPLPNLKPHDSVTEKYLRSMQQSSVGVRPEAKALLNAYEVYKTSPGTRALKSELDKTIYADAIIDPPGLGPLSYLCAKALAKIYKPNELVDIVTKDPLAIRTYYDTLDIDLPLEDCYYIDDEKYWFRYVSTRHKDTSLQLQKLNWKNIGITMKFERFLQQLPAEYWDDDAMRTLAEKINTFVTNLHIEHLQSIRETTLLRYLKNDSISSTSSSDSSTYICSSSVSEVVEDEDFIGEESYISSSESNKASQVRDISNKRQLSKISSGTSGGGVSGASVDTTWSYGLKSIDASGSWYDECRAISEREIKREKREVQRAKKARRLERRERRALLNEQLDLERDLAEKVAEEKANRDRLARRKAEKDEKEDEMVSVFGMEVVPASDDNIFNDESDGRNPEKLKQRLKAFRDPLIAEYCHHLNFHFLRHFPFLTSLIIEFNGPPPPIKYEDWYFHFSTRDIERLADGIRSLSKLKIFSLRNSRMNGKKLYIIAKSLKTIYTLQSIDFSYANLKEDCGDGLYELFQNTLSIKSLELAGNEIGDALCDLAIALGDYDGSLQYLGLGGNSLSFDALRIFCSHIINTSQVRELCLRGAMLSQMTITYCIGQQLILKHAALRGIDLSAVPIESDTAIELLKALKNNNKIRKFDIRGCDLPADMELDFEILLKGNIFRFNYPAIGDIKKSIVRIDESIAKRRNKIFLRAMQAVEARAKCLANRAEDYQANREIKSKAHDRMFSIPTSVVEEIKSESIENDDDDRRSTISQRHSKDPNTFNEAEIKSRFWFFESPNKRTKANKKWTSVVFN